MKNLITHIRMNQMELLHKIIGKVIVLLLVCAALGFAADNKVEPPAACRHCGMDRTVYGHSRMMLTYADGSSTGTCSLNCAVIDMREAKGKAVLSYQVADYNTKKLIDTQTATWVMGGKKQGVMTPVAKWAFADRNGAASFIKANGGKPATFDEVLKATEKELAESGGPKKQHGHAEHSGH